MTPIEEHGGYKVKRMDKFRLAGTNGSKAMVVEAMVQRARGMVTAGPRTSSQIYIAARICQLYGIPFRCHVPQGPETAETADVTDHGGTVVRHRAGYNSVLTARATADHAGRAGWVYLPLWLRSMRTVQVVAPEVGNVPKDTRRIVAAAGSGMTVAAINTGLAERGMDIPVLAVRVGADPTITIKQFGPFGGGRWELVPGEGGYKEPSYGKWLGDVALDPWYEAKCLPYLQPGDLLWVASYGTHHPHTKGG